MTIIFNIHNDKLNGFLKCPGWLKWYLCTGRCDIKKFSFTPGICFGNSHLGCQFTKTSGIGTGCIDVDDNSIPEIYLILFFLAVNDRFSNLFFALFFIICQSPFQQIKIIRQNMSRATITVSNSYHSTFLGMFNIFWQFPFYDLIKTDIFPIRQVFFQNRPVFIRNNHRVTGPGTEIINFIKNPF